MSKCTPSHLVRASKDVPMLTRSTSFPCSRIHSPKVDEEAHKQGTTGKGPMPNTYTSSCLIMPLLLLLCCIACTSRYFIHRIAAGQTSTLPNCQVTAS
eukprot:1157479-Pelagomonas_calceolata.AAC.6